jgi:hypothetical protein
MKNYLLKIFSAIITVLILTTGCSVKNVIWGNTEVERNYDEKGDLLLYSRENCKLKKMGFHIHNIAIERVTTKKYKNGKIIEKKFTKSRISNSTDFDGELLRSYTILWDSCGHRTKEYR